MISGYAIYPCAGAFIVVGCYVTMIGIRMCKEARVTWTWPSTEGIVQGTEIVETCGSGARSGTVFQPVVTYEYSVDGQNYTGKRIMSLDIASSAAYARGVIAKYPVGAIVTVYYDSCSPQDAVLRRGNDGNTIGIPAVGIFFVIVGMAVGLGYYLQLFQTNGN